MILEIRQLDLSEDTLQRFQAEVERRQIDPESLIAELIQLGLKKPQKINDFSSLAGKWTEEDAREFEIATAAFSEIDEEMWRESSPG